MALPTRVNPGDLIRAELMNDILALLSALDGRVTTLESSPTSHGPVITAVLPAGAVHVGDEIQVLGPNFGFSLGSQRVSIAGISVLSFKSGSNDQKLIFDIPIISDLPAAGRQVVLSVTNQTSTEERDLQVLPKQIAISGNLDVNWRSVRPQIIKPGAAATFEFRVQSRATQPAQYQIQATIPGVAPNLIQILNEDGSENTASVMNLDPLQQSILRVRVVAAPGATFTLTTSVTAPGVIAPLDARSFPIQTFVPDADSSTTLSFQQAIPVAAFTAATNTVNVPVGGAAQITMQATFSKVAVFDISVVITAGGGWTVELPGAPAPTQRFDIKEGDLKPPPAQRPLSFIFKALTGATVGKAEFRLDNVTDNTHQVFPIDLAPTAA